MDVRLFFPILSAKILIFLIRFFRLGGATAAPGLFALKIASSLVRNLTKNLKTTVLISGTNGKTTTARLLSSVLQKAGFKILHNRTGSNLMRGLASVLIEKVSLTGKFKENLGLFEVDEFVFPQALKEIKPQIVILTNLFRDQLDRYGEIDKIRNFWKEALQNLSKNSLLILNADDPTIADLGRALKCQVLYFGLEDITHLSFNTPHTADVRTCLSCGNSLNYKGYFLSHLGHYQCLRCKIFRPKPDISAIKVNLKGVEGSKIEIKTNDERFDLEAPLPGIYNIYNVLAATCAAKRLNINLKILQEGIKDIKTAFGRFEEIRAGDKKVFLILVKNPTGANEVLKLIFSNSSPKNFFFALNDLFADGQDVSWIWDVDFEILKDKVNFAVLSGIRAYDIALRLKYAGVSMDKISVQNNLKIALNRALNNVKSINDTLFLLASYTAMLQLRKILPVKKFWQE